MKKSFFLRSIAVGLAAVLFCGAVGAGGAFAVESADDLSSHKLSERYSIYTKKDGETDEVYPYYNLYLYEGKKKGYRDATVDGAVIDMVSGVTDKKEAIPYVDGGFIWNPEEIEQVTWFFEIQESGYYQILAEYTSVQEGTESPRRKMTIDGKTHFAEMKNIVFDRLWYDESEPNVNSIGDEVRPKQIERFRKRSFRISDALGRYNEPLRIYLEAGTHTLTLDALQEPVCLHSIAFVAPEEVPTYAEVLEEYRKNGYQNAAKGIKLDAERPYEKSDISIRMECSADPLADPSAIDGVVFNSLGGSNWSEGNQFVTWQFDVEADGLYRIDLRTYQKYNDGLSSYRQILIDDQVPYQEFLCYEFGHSDWDTASLKNEDDVYLVWLEKGTHTFTMTVKTSPYLEVLLELETTLDILSGVLSDVIMVTGVNPDTNFDYELDEKIPGLMDDLNAISESLKLQIEILAGMSNVQTSAVSSLEEIRYRIEKMIKEPETISRNVSNMISDQTLLSSWISGFNNLALMLDYIRLESPDAPLENYHSNFFQNLWYGFRQFLISFTRDYSAVSSTVAGEEVVEVWVSRGKEWAESLNQIIQEDFSKSHDTQIRLNILPAGQLGVSGVLLLALASDTAPDVVLGTDSVTPAEYGMRDAVADLSVLEGYDEVRQWFLEGAMIPFEMEGKVYALPETMDFTIMYAREDIMKELGLKIPDTWQELYSTILPELKRKGMDFWYEGSLYTFLFQNGGALYSEDGLASTLDSAEGIDAFKQFTDLFLIYQVPQAANFYNRFRAGQIPLGISSFATYLSLAAAASELDGKWQVYPIPGTVKEDGSIDRSTMLTLTSSMIFADTEVLDASWEFVKWYSSSEVQLRYANDLVASIGSSAKWFSANLDAFDKLSLDTQLRTVVKTQQQWLKGVPNVKGGYISARHIENARVRTVIQGMNYRQSIEKAADDITAELVLKAKEIELIRSRNKK